jgi:hypothetical protein
MNIQSLPLDDRKRILKNEIKEHIESRGGHESYPKECCNSFFKWWTEKSNSGWSKKLRFEHEDFWDTGARLDHWMEKESRRNPHLFKHQVTEKYRPAGPVKTKEQLEEEDRGRREMAEIYDAIKERVEETKSKPAVGLRRGGFMDEQYLAFKKKYDEEK